MHDAYNWCTFGGSFLREGPVKILQIALLMQETRLDLSSYIPAFQKACCRANEASNLGAAAMAVWPVTAPRIANG